MESSNPTVTSDLHEPAKTCYEYQPIHSKSEIRILELHPLDLHDPGALHGNLITARLADKPSYEAISYVWGEPNFSETLYLPTGSLGITPNLAAALRCFRHPNEKRRLWADAVCINQNGGDEKGHQVQLMGEVFKNTDHMLAWLGEGDEKPDAAIAFLENLGNESWRYGVPPERPYGCMGKSIAGAGIRTALSNLNSQVLSNLAKLERLFRQEWFHRLWIVQGVALAPKFILHNEMGTLDHEIFSRAIAPFYRLTKLPNVSKVTSLFSEVSFLIAVRWSQQTDTLTFRLFDFIKLTQEKRYSNELDSIYALLGLSRASDDINVEVDYEISLTDLLIDFTYGCLSRNALWVMQGAGMLIKELDGDDNEHASSLPSWVCNFKTRPTWMMGLENKDRAQKKVSTMLKSALMPLIEIRGTLIDDANMVIQTPDSLFRSRAGNWDYCHILEHLLRLMELWSQSSPEASYCSEENEESAFARTLMADGMWSNLSSDFYDEDYSSLRWEWRNFQSVASRMEKMDNTIDTVRVRKFPKSRKEQESTSAVYITFFAKDRS